MRPINMLVVHCAASAFGADKRAADIRVDHMKPKSERGNGWADIGYHYVICLDGTVELGRKEATIGAHAAKFNKHSIGICLIGGLDARRKPANTFTDAQYASLERLLSDLRQRFPTAEILGHRDLPKVAKDCPCFDVRGWCVSRGIAPKRS